jgi:hypothetical protein
MIFLRPASPPKCAAAMTPAAGPDSTMRHGIFVASAHEMMPPFDCIMCKGTLTPAQFTHASTVASNTVLQGEGARTALLVTEGFRDLLEIHGEHELGARL